MSIRFTKMHGLGNDFVVFDAINQSLSLTSEQVRFIADRHFGVGCDQLLLVERPTKPGVDFRYRIFNSDGGEVGQCGNGARCFARFVREKGLTQKDEIVVETASGIIRLYVEADGQIRVNMGAPRFTPDEIPFRAETEAALYPIEVAGQPYAIGAVSMGNPHAVLQVDDVDKATVESLGPALESHPRFPERVNVGFLQVVDRGHIRVRVFERGVGETLACGTGASAAFVVGRLWGLLDEVVKVDLRGGTLSIRWVGGKEPVWMTGPATTVFEGIMEL